MGGKRLIRPLAVAASFVVVSVFGADQARALPALQLYIEGATYNRATDSWEFAPGSGSAGDSFRVWTIAKTRKDGGKSTPITDGRLVIAYDRTLGNIDIEVTPTLIGGDGEYGNFEDVNVPDAVGDRYFYDPENDAYDYEEHGEYDPIKGTPAGIGSHSIYGHGTAWQEFVLGDFDQGETNIADFEYALPDPTKHIGQINAYDIRVLGADGGSVEEIGLHFDLYGRKSNGKITNAPFSHDADGFLVSTPSPTAAGLGGGLLVLTTLSRSRRRHADRG